jgi:tRNA-dihydrouridine synthase B
MRDVNSDFLSRQNFPLCLAPMVGLSHVVQRKMIQFYMPKNASTFWPTEMLNSRRIPNEVLGSNSETFVDPDESNIVPQILGNEMKAIHESIKRLKNEWDIQGVDINMGCPVQKALKHNYGVALMGDSDYAARVVEYAAEAAQKLSVPIPVSVKLRAVGSTQSVPELITFVEKLVQAGADWITLHPRSAEQKRRGAADWSQITELKKNIKVPVIGNGDIQIADDVIRMIEQTGCDGVMVGRALVARPWMVWQLGEKLNFESPVHFENHKAPQTQVEEGAEFGRMLMKYIEFTEIYFKGKIGMSESLILRRILFFIKTTHVWLEFGHTLMSYSTRAQTVDELKILVEKFFADEQRMYQKTELRQ